MLFQLILSPNVVPYLTVQRNNNKNIINKGYIVQNEGAPRPLVRFRRIRFGNNDPRERDPFRLRNRLFLFRP